MAGRQRLWKKDGTAVDTHKLHNKHTRGFSQGCFLLAYSRLAALLGEAETRGGNPYTSVILKCSVAVECLFCAWLRSCQRPPPVLPRGLSQRMPHCQTQPRHGREVALGVLLLHISWASVRPDTHFENTSLAPISLLLQGVLSGEAQQDSKANALR